jgi:hypothetical protein
MPAKGFEVRRLSGSIGAEILGIDLASEPGDNVIAEIRQIWLEHNVIFFRDQDLPPAKFLAFAKRFGEVVPHFGKPAARPRTANDLPCLVSLRSRPSELLPILGPPCWYFSNHSRSGSTGCRHRSTSAIGSMLPVTLRGRLDWSPTHASHFRRRRPSRGTIAAFAWPGSTVRLLAPRRVRAASRLLAVAVAIGVVAIGIGTILTSRTHD